MTPLLSFPFPSSFPPFFFFFFFFLCFGNGNIQKVDSHLVVYRVWSRDGLVHLDVQEHGAF